ncbi:MAG: PAS domain-containing sensor histidine kinase [Oscillospiraceae bacterium]|nr:PAS domain-containing sensor histidine kinase [Oscillospiraceae bacterium]MBQ9148521.1 PAS domain-containing sensor histidine kinase [Oscillospiraceae bacterium]
MTKRIFHAICAVALAVLLACSVVIIGALYPYFTDVQRDQLKTQTALAAQAVTAEGIDYLNTLGEIDTRVTWIGSDGTVLFDSHSQSDSMQNHLERQEVIDALATGYGESIRFSDTLMEQSVYIAQRLSDGSVLRLSVAQNSAMTLALGMAQNIAIVILIVLAISLLLAQRLSQVIVQPLNELNLNDPAANEGYEEITPLLRRIESQQRQLRAIEVELKRKQREFDAVTNNMEEGLVLLSDQSIVLTMNPAAARLIGLSRPFVGISFHTIAQIPAIEAVIAQALEGQRAEGEFEMRGNSYQVEADPVKSGGAALLILDVTQKRQAENQRREFTANVSHELKTPLHAISGYAELLKSGLVQPQDVQGFAGKIFTEAQRLIRLVEDILRLSRLDEGAAEIRREPVDLFVLAQEAVNHVSPTAQKAGVEIHLQGDSAIVNGIPQQLAGIVTNLCTNAIKYNRPGGRVDVGISKTCQGVTLTVADTGIGIAPEHQERIFERFYRVDKSHSKAVGGTGLGLSIVKHAALIHNAKIDLQSQVDVGTTVRVIFPV